MTPNEKSYICYRGRKYRDREHRLQITYGEGECAPIVDAEQEEPMAEEKDVVKEFGDMLIKSVQDLSRQIEEMGQRFTVAESRQCETPGDFHIGEGSGTSHHLQGNYATQHVASHTPPCSTMPTFLVADTGVGVQQEQEPAHMGDYFAEYRAYGQEFRDALTFHDFF